MNVRQDDRQPFLAAIARFGALFDVLEYCPGPWEMLYMPK